MNIKLEKQINPSEVQSKIWNKIFLSIFFASMALNLGQSMSNSLLAKYADSMGAPASQIGILMSMFAITALIFRFVAGPSMDTYNRKYLVMASMTIMAMAYFGFSMSSTVSSLMAFRLLQGIGNAFGNVCCLAMVADALPKNKFGTGMGYFSLSQVVAQAIGPTIGLTLVDWVGYSKTYIITGGVMLCALIVAGQIKIYFKRSKKLKISLSNAIAKEALIPATVILFLGMGFTTINSFLIVYAAKKGVETGIGLFFLVYAVTLLFTRPLVGKMTDKYGFVKVTIPAIAMTGISLVIISMSASLPMFLVAAFVNAFGFGACQPALQSLAMKSVSKERRGAGSATNYIGMDLGTIIGPIIAGICAENFGYSSMWYVMIIPLLIGLLLVFIFREKIVKIEENHRTSI